MPFLTGYRPAPASPELVSDTHFGRGVSAVRLRAELHGDGRDRTVAIMREEAHAWASSECDAMNAVIRHEYREAQMACESAQSSLPDMARA